MDKDKIQEKVIEIISEMSGVDKARITIKSHFIEDLGNDSLDNIELCMAIEEEFETDIPDEEVEKMMRVEDVVNYLMEKV